MKKIKLLSVFLLLFIISCNKKNKIEDIFITNKNYYWQFSNTCHYSIACGGINFQFKEDGYSHRYDFSVQNGYTLNEGFSNSDIQIMPEKWNLKNDSTLIWDNIEHIDNTVIVLQYLDPRDKKTECWIRLLKVLGEK